MEFEKKTPYLQWWHELLCVFLFCKCYCSFKDILVHWVIYGEKKKKVDSISFPFQNHWRQSQLLHLSTNNLDDRKSSRESPLKCQTIITFIHANIDIFTNDLRPIHHFKKYPFRRIEFAVRSKLRIFSFQPLILFLFYSAKWINRLWRWKITKKM